MADLSKMLRYWADALTGVHTPEEMASVKRVMRIAADVLESASQPGGGEAEAFMPASTQEAHAFVAGLTASATGPESRRLAFPLPEGGTVAVIFPCDIEVESINMLAKMLIEMALRQLKYEREAQREKHCQCNACIGGTIHASDCAVHNMPAEPNGRCDCGALQIAAPSAGNGGAD